MNVSLLCFFLVCLQFTGKKKSRPTLNYVSEFWDLSFQLSAICLCKESPENRTRLRLQRHLQCHFMCSFVTTLNSHSFSCSRLLIVWVALSGSLESPRHCFYCLWLPWDIKQRFWSVLALLFVCRSKIAGANFNLTVESSTLLSWLRTMKLVRFNAKLM